MRPLSVSTGAPLRLREAGPRSGITRLPPDDLRLQVLHLVSLRPDLHSWYRELRGITHSDKFPTTVVLKSSYCEVDGANLCCRVPLGQRRRSSPFSRVADGN